MWSITRLSWRWNRRRRLCTASPRRIEDEGDWFYSSEWWGSESEFNKNTVFRSNSGKGTGVVSVLAYPSRPNKIYWPETEKWLQQRCAEMHPASSDYDLMAAVYGKKRMHILWIGQGRGSLPLFLASKVQVAVIHVVEIDPVVISASLQAMSVMTLSGQRALQKPDIVDEVMWKGIHERLYLYESDAEKFVLENKNPYDIIFIDAYDVDDIFPMSSS